MTFDKLSTLNTLSAITPWLFVYMRDWARYNKLLGINWVSHVRWSSCEKKKGIFFLYQVILLEKGTMLAVFLNNLISFLINSCIFLVPALHSSPPYVNNSTDRTGWPLRVAFQRGSLPSRWPRGHRGWRRGRYRHWGYFCPLPHLRFLMF